MDRRKQKALQLWKSDQLTSKKLQKIATTLKPLPADLDPLKNAFTKVQKALSPRSIIKGGSYGKGTNLYSRKEIDIVVICSDFTEPLISNFLNELKQIVLNKLEVENIKTSPHAVQFVLDGIDIDLLPATQLSKEKSISGDGVITSAAFSKQQVDFIRTLPQYGRFLNGIRILKFWKEQQFPKFQVRSKTSYNKTPKSYMMEVVLAYVLSIMQEKKPNYLKIFNKTMEVFCEFGKQFKLVYKNDRFIREKTNEGPIILDPVNENNNLLSRFDPSELLVQARKAISVNTKEAERKAKEEVERLSKEEKVIIVVGNKGVGKTSLLNRLFNLNMNASDHPRHVTKKPDIRFVDGYKVIDTVGLDLDTDNFPVLSDEEGKKLVIVLIVNDKRYYDTLDQVAQKLQITNFKDKFNIVRTFDFKHNDIPLSVDDISLQTIEEFESFVLPQRRTNKTVQKPCTIPKKKKIVQKKNQVSLKRVHPKVLTTFTGWRKRKGCDFSLLSSLSKSEVEKYSKVGNAFLKTIIELQHVHDSTIKHQVEELSNHSVLKKFITSKKVSEKDIQQIYGNSNLSEKQYADVLRAIIGKCCCDKNTQGKFNVFLCFDQLLIFHNSDSFFYDF